MFRYWENVHYQYRMGLYDEMEFEKQKIAWDEYINANERTAEYWCSVRHMFSPMFAAELDSLLKNPPGNGNQCNAR